LSFERSRREVIEEFGERKNIENSGDVKKKLVLDIPRRDPNCNGYRQTQRDKEVLQLWGNRSSRCKVLQTKERKERGSKNCGRSKRGFFHGQGVSTNLPALVDSKV